MKSHKFGRKAAQDVFADDRVVIEVTLGDPPTDREYCSKYVAAKLTPQQATALKRLQSGLSNGKDKPTSGADAIRHLLDQIKTE